MDDFFSPPTDHNMDAVSLYDEGLRLYKLEQYSEAFQLLKKAAELGNVKSQLIIGDCYALGRGVDKNRPTALDWYVKAAEQNDIICKLGEQIPQEWTTAAKVAMCFFVCGLHAYNSDEESKGAFQAIEAAAKIGYPQAQCWLGDYFYKRAYSLEKFIYMEEEYNDDYDDTKDFDEMLHEYSKAAYWFIKAYTQGLTEAKEALYKALYNYSLGSEFYGDINPYFGKFVGDATHLELLEDYVNESNINAQRFLGFRYARGDVVEQDLSKAVNCYEKVVEQRGDVYNLPFVIGRCYTEGKGVNIDYSKAVYWFEKGVEHGWMSSLLALGNCYKTGGVGLNKDISKAVYWYIRSAESYLEDSTKECITGDVAKEAHRIFKINKRAAKRGDTNAIAQLATCYKCGIGVKKNLNKAEYWYEKAAMLGDVNTQYELGERYRTGKNLRKDISKADYWNDKAAVRGHMKAQYLLGQRYDTNNNEEDNKTAFSWYKKAAYQGYKDAQYKLGNFYKNGKGVEPDILKSVYWYARAVNGDI